MEGTSNAIFYALIHSANGFWYYLPREVALSFIFFLLPFMLDLAIGLHASEQSLDFIMKLAHTFIAAERNFLHGPSRHGPHSAAFLSFFGFICGRYTEGRFAMKKLLITLVLLTISIPVWGASTRQNRGDSLIFVGISPVGLHIPTLVTMPVGLGVYLGKNFLIGAETGNVTFDTDSDGSDGDSSAEGSYNNSGIYARWFPGTNSFNLGLALHKRIFSATATASSLDPTYGVVDVEASLDADATVGSFILGNQWMMDFGLVLAMDWIIVSGLIDSKVDSSFSGRVVTSSGQVISIEELDPETVADAERELNSIGEDINTISAFPGILVFTIGWAF